MSRRLSLLRVIKNVKFVRISEGFNGALHGTVRCSFVTYLYRRVASFGATLAVARSLRRVSVAAKEKGNARIE